MLYPLNIRIFLLYLIILLIFFVPEAFYTLFIRTPEVAESLTFIEEIISFVKFILPFVIVSYLVNIFMFGIYVDNASKYYKGGKHSPVIFSFFEAMSRFVPLLYTFVVLTILISVPVSVLTALGVFLRDLTGSNSYFNFLVIIGNIISIMFLMLFFLSPVISVLGRKFYFVKQFRYSKELVYRNILWVFLFLASVIVLVFILGAISLIPAYVVSYMRLNGIITFGKFYYVTNIILGVFQRFVLTYIILFLIEAFVGFYLSVKGSRI